MWKYGVAVCALVLSLPGAAQAFEWNGFRSGMSPDEVRDAAAAQSLVLDREPDSAANVTVPLYDDGGDSRGFLTMCQGQLARAGTGLEDLDVAHIARRADEFAQYGEAQLRIITMETGARGLELFWASDSDEIGLVMVRVGDQQLMQETRADIGLWDLCANRGLDESEPGEDFDPAEDEEPPTPEELLLDALGRALRGEGEGQ
jgi:hypothetical protein